MTPIHYLVVSLLMMLFAAFTAFASRTNELDQPIVIFVAVLAWLVVACVFIGSLLRCVIVAGGVFLN